MATISRIEQWRLDTSMLISYRFTLDGPAAPYWPTVATFAATYGDALNPDAVTSKAQITGRSETAIRRTLVADIRAVKRSRSIVDAHKG